MKRIDDNEIKSICIDLLEQFNKLCEENNLAYSIAYGTMLGEVRHGGFIPWDNDIDVIMPRDDYERLVSLRYREGKYEIKNYRYSSDYYYSFCKMIDKSTILIEENRAEHDMGVFIDIFPVDLVSGEDNNYKGVEIVQKINKAICDSCGSSNEKKYSKTYIKWIIKRIIKTLFGRKILIRLVDTMCQKTTNRNKGKSRIRFTNLVYGVYGQKDIFPYSLWDSIVTVDFDGIKCKMIKNYDYILSSLYGNYMELPPDDKRYSHNILAYHKDDFRND